MAPHAWLDSLSEDWPSQLGSDRSQSNQHHSLPRPQPSTKSKPAPSRIPRLDTDSNRPSSCPPTEDDSRVLGEWSANDINITSPKRVASKLSQEVRIESRSVSNSTADSVVHNTVSRRSPGASPSKTKGNTPEWRRRLVQGELPYGEQRDLFTSTAGGLESMFTRPAAVAATIEEADDIEEEEEPQPHETTLPSSPPMRHHDEPSDDVFVDRSQSQMLPGEQPRSKTRAMKYRMTEDDTMDATNYSDSVLIGGAMGDDVFSDVPVENLDVPPHSDPSIDPDSRKVSGQSVLRHEDFSPIFISPAKALEGDSDIVVAAPEVPPSELKKRLHHLRWNQLKMTGAAIDGRLLDGSSLADGTSNQVNTKDFEKLAGFINLKRGGRSNDGSFLHRPLSSLLNADTSEMLPEESLQAGTPKQLPSPRTYRSAENGISPPFPRVPNPGPHKSSTQDQDAAKAKSPLKLFGPYDTFTNQTLMRRISQFEDQMSNGSRLSSARFPMGQPPKRGPATTQQRVVSKSSQGSRSSSAQFGAGELDGFEFQHHFSHRSIREPGLDAPAGQQRQTSMSREFSPTSPPSVAKNLFVGKRHHATTRSTTASKFSTFRTSVGVGHTNEPPQPLDSAEVPATPRRESEGKRLRNSPSKDPTPKRRRTLHKTDIAYHVDHGYPVSKSVEDSHHQMQSAMGKKRRDSRDGEVQQLADPDVLATRQMLRPRTPTPTQRSSVQKEQHPFADSSYNAEGLENNSARPSSGVSGAQMLDPDRKPSIRTEDFINEAHKIMAIIRSRANGQTGLSSVEESELENGHLEPEALDTSFQESTKEPFSRPPSRDGRPLPQVNARQDDPELAARLKKYEERSDLEDLLVSSARSMDIAQDAIRAAKEAEEQARTLVTDSLRRVHLADDSVISDPPNIRISSSQTLSHRPSAETIGGASTRDGPVSQASASSGTSTSRSIPTGSSRGSDSRKTIAPETISHLIPDQVGNMYLDRDRHIWIKSKKSTSVRKIQNILPSSNSEDDPFAGIPDLTVDATLEMRNLKSPTKDVPDVDQDAEDTKLSSDFPSLARAESTKSFFSSPNRSPSQLSPEQPSQRSPEQPRPTPMKPATKATVTVTGKETVKETVEHEISIHEDCIPRITPSKKHLTISFSSPIASFIQDPPREYSSASEENGNSSAFAHERISTFSVKRGRTPLSQRRGTMRGSQRGSLGGRGRQVSQGKQQFVPRPVSRIDEREEDSKLEQALPNFQELSVLEDQSKMDQSSVMQTPAAAEQRRPSLSFAMSTPGQMDTPNPRNADDIIAQCVGRLSLTPLSEFTIHPDRSLGFEASYIVDNQRLVTGDGSKRVLSQTVRDLVARLTEVEPYEPYWEHMEDLDLSDKRLTSLHMLDKFCGGVIRLKASNNTLRDPSGIPSTVRELTISHNQLADLSCWGHMMNLQFLDISNNQIESLSSLKNMVHLRSFTADNCKITSLDALKDHDGIEEIRARGNQIGSLDFAGWKARRLKTLDLADNVISSVSNLQALPELIALHLKGNRLIEFVQAKAKAARSIAMIDLNDNNISRIDISGFPELKILQLDRNQLVRIDGLKSIILDTLSLREQSGQKSLDMANIYHAHEVRKLYLSGNRLPSFDPPGAFPNLQVLELASCGLESLSKDIGCRLRNLRQINLNFNALKDLSPLRRATRLARMLVAGNRIESGAIVVDMLINFHHLKDLDMRANPFTQSFYPPLHMLASSTAAATAAETFTLPDADAARDRVYTERLDLETAMLRRLYVLIYRAQILKLEKLDGLVLDPGLQDLEDHVWQALVDKNIILRPEELLKTDYLVRKEGRAKGKSDEDSGVVDGTMTSSVWGAEDSFA